MAACTRVLDLEPRFAEFADFLAELTIRRTDIDEAFSARKQALLDERARRADRLVSSAETLAAGAEANLLKLAEPRNRLTAEQSWR